MKRGYLLMLVAVMAFGGALLANQTEQEVMAEEPRKMAHVEIVIPHTPTPAPERSDFDLQHLSVCTGSNVRNEAEPVLAETPEAEEILAEEEEPLTEAVDAPELTCLGTWTISAYCPCEICCGEYASGYTASGTLATEGRTVACNALPMGTRIMIDGHEYTVEDTGWTPYGDEWIDLFFDTHDDALNWGIQMKEVYLIND